MSKKTLKNVALGSASALALAAAGTASAVEFQAGNTSVNVYGYAQLDIIYDVDADLGSRSAQDVGAASDTDNTGHFSMDASTSRLGVETRTPTSMGGDLRTVIEGDFYGGGGGTFRLRRAFGEWNGILAGQEWSNFVTFIGSTPTLSFTGTLGYPRGARNAQLRYTFDNFSIALEDVGQGDFFDGSDAGAGIEKRSLPDLTLRFQDTSGPVNFATGAVLRQIEWEFDDGTDNESESAFGFGLMGAASMEVAPGTTIRGVITGGPGIGTYMYVNPASAAFTDTTSDLDVEPITAYGGTIGLSQALGQGNLNIAYSTTIADLDDAVDDGTLTEDNIEQLTAVYLNYIWSPVNRVTYGVEVSWNEAKTQGGDSEDAVRLQGSVRYSF
ncbi:hypothetical protein J2T57_003225 [Natronocella acetinitrilica]|uniref:Porin n=1 Tax=Natronocella acetinitrilica TaxID=414046 RepID=A0AAE3G570_9GAMM|nr:DcaP family trimeric outer membrane transporter [Natronocella acetinitrilica]MCP1676066.1 hypothetical protein [Natronocella acetinitrilica]